MTSARVPGQPLFFLALVVGGWVVLRASLLWPNTVATPALVARKTDIAPALATVMAAARPPSPAATMTATIPPPFAIQASQVLTSGQTVRAVAMAARSNPDRVALALLGMVRIGSAAPLMIPVARDDVSAPDPRRPPLSAPLPSSLSPSGQRESKWSASAWLVARGPGGPVAGVAGQQLGGSQAGARLAYALDDNRRWSLVARVASPLGGSGQEGAVGVEWRPTRLPVRVAIENRIDIQSGRSAPAVGLVGGAGPVTIAPHLTVEGYGQAGIVARNGGTGYADGSIRVNRRLASLGLADFDLGAGGWGGRQPGVGRLDVGPSLGVSVPVVGHRLRASVDWRERVAGRALPGSGLVLTLGTDF